VGAFELFLDLLYVGIIGIVGDAASHHPTGDSFHKFCIIFIIGWKIWSDLTLVISWFETGAYSIFLTEQHL
jgi:low temperature requirement protein LtrA